MNKAFYEGYMHKQAEGPPPLPVKPQVKPPALPKYNPADSINKPLSKADQASRRSFQSGAKPALKSQVKPGIVRAGTAVKGLPGVAGRASRVARLRHGLGITPWGAAFEGALYGGSKYVDYLDNTMEDFNRGHNLQMERFRQLTGMPRRQGPNATMAPDE